MSLGASTELARWAALLLLVGCPGPSAEKGAIDSGEQDSQVQDGCVDTSDGATEEPYNGLDDDCDPATPDDDLDGDGHGAVAAGGEDCDDADATVSPEAAERCDGLDNDCDGNTDEGEAEDASTWYADADSDGVGDDSTTTTACSQPVGHVAEPGDCDDGDASTYPGAEEICGDGVVNGCEDEISALEACTPGGVLGLSTADLKISGEAEFDYAGCAVSRAGDVDGDGLDDMVVGAYGDDGGGSAAGAAYLLLGGGALEGATGELNLSGADLELTGEQPGDYAGFAVSGAGDVDGDGLGDMAVGAYWADTHGRNAGMAYLLLGGGASGELSLSSADLKLMGEAEDDQAGYALSRAGDLDGDDLDDLLVGAHQQSSVEEEAGAAYVLLAGGALEGSSGSLDLADADWKLTGEAEGDHAAFSTAEAGDVDGDGLDDLLLGAPDEETGGYDAGAAYLLLGGGALEGASSPLGLASADLKLVGENNRDSAGYSVAGGGDLDGDGLDDLAVGACHDDTTANNAGAVYLWLGEGTLESTSETLELVSAALKLLGQSSSDYAGWSVSWAGDVDGDSLEDLLVGARGEASLGEESGAAYLLLGGGALQDASGTLALASAEQKLMAEAAGDQAGWWVSGVGDVDGDRFDDVAVGANSQDAGGSDAGAAYLISYFGDY